ncbi:MAG: alkanesulfonate monooxygenase SsuD [Candidatus Azotimanducaceae bacterium]|jgi:alkanesulfonate monooxygenase SsuD/methylene tetrahydromethanopterin reductase-like flavin-dependent oxidoreductase (luciferase family)
MRLGALLTPSIGAEPMALANQASALEKAGYSSIWTAQAMGRGFLMTDPFIALSVAAAVTTKVELGTAVLQLPLYNPTDIALKAFSLMQVAGNRLLLGVGAGSTESDYTIHRQDFSARFKTFSTCIAELKATFVEGQANGGAINPPASIASGPPVLFGTWGKHVVSAASEFDGWIASGMHRSPAECAEALERYRAAGGSRAIVSTIQVTAATDLKELKTRLEGYEKVGFDDAVVMIMPGGPAIEAVRDLVSF